MTPETTISISVIFSIVAVAGTIITIINSFKNNSEKETNRRLDIEKQFVKVNVKLDAICTTMSELKDKSEKSNEEIQNIKENIIKIVGKMENLEERVEALEKRERI